MFSQEEPDFFGDELRIISQCPLCRSRYNPLKVKILEENEEAHLVHITCNKCKAYVVAVILNTAMGVSSVGMITDLTPEDVLKFKEFNCITADEVIAVHEELTQKSCLKELVNFN